MPSKPNREGFSRREWASLAGTIATVAPLAAQEAPNPERDMLKRHLESNARAASAMEAVALTPADEPIFGLVVR